MFLQNEMSQQRKFPGRMVIVAPAFSLFVTKQKKKANILKTEPLRIKEPALAEFENENIFLLDGNQF